MGKRQVTIVALGALALFGSAFLLARPAYRTWQSYRNHLDFCGNSEVRTTDRKRITSAISYIRNPYFRRRALLSTHGALDTWSPMDPTTCCSVIFGGRVGDYAITPRTIFNGGPTAYVRFDALPPFTRGGERLSVLTDRCGQVYEFSG